MIKLIKRLSSQLWVAIFWTLLVMVLLCIPGSEFPQPGVFADIQNLDKLIHVFLFGNFVFLWGSYTHVGQTDRQHWFKMLIIITLIGIVFGVVMEIIQRHFIPFRSFEWVDILADSIGAVLAAALLGFWGKRLGLLD